MSHGAPRLEDAVMTRRELLCRSGMGMGALALGRRDGRGRAAGHHARRFTGDGDAGGGRIGGTTDRIGEPASAQGAAACG